MFYLDTKGLEKYINDIFSRLKPIADEYEIFKELNICFSETTPLNYQGVYCYSDKKGYHYCCTERGEVTLNNRTHSLFEITYWAIESPVFNMASDYEKKNRVHGQDFRRVIFQKELELFEELGGNYRKRAEIDIDEILAVAPYNDNINLNDV
jgi:hypothetical protein